MTNQNFLTSSYFRSAVAPRRGGRRRDRPPRRLAAAKLAAVAPSTRRRSRGRRRGRRVRAIAYATPSLSAFLTWVFALPIYILRPSNSSNSTELSHLPLLTPYGMRVLCSLVTSLKRWVGSPSFPPSNCCPSKKTLCKTLK